MGWHVRTFGNFALAKWVWGGLANRCGTKGALSTGSYPDFACKEATSLIATVKAVSHSSIMVVRFVMRTSISNMTNQVFSRWLTADLARTSHNSTLHLCGSPSLMRKLLSLAR